MRRLSALLALATVTLPLGAEGAAVALSDAGVRLRWSAACVVYHLNELGSADQPLERVRAAVNGAFQTWSEAAGAPMPLLYGGLTDQAATGGTGVAARNVVIWRESKADWGPMDPSIVGLTTLTFEVEQGRIIDADIELNGAYFEFTTASDGAQWDVQAVVTHEVGHWLGLDDSEEPGAVMNPMRVAGDLDRRVLRADDLAALAAAYPDGPATGACDDSTVGDFYPRPSTGAAASAGGCQAGTGESGGPMAWLLLCLVAFLALRRRAGLMAALAVALLAVPAQAYVLYMSDTPDVPLRWFSRTTKVVFDDIAPEEVEASAARWAIARSYRVWSDLACEGRQVPFDMSFQGPEAGHRVGFDPDATNENLVVFVRKASQWLHGNEVLAMTSLTYDTVTGEVVDGDLELNDVQFRYAIDANKFEADLENTVVHEAGHFLGLDHSLASDATMYAKAPLGETKKRTLTQDDIGGYCALYGPSAPPLPTGTPPPASSGCSAGSRGTAGGPWLALWLFLGLVFGAARWQGREKTSRMA